MGYVKGAILAFKHRKKLGTLLLVSVGSFLAIFFFLLSPSQKQTETNTGDTAQNLPESVMRWKPQVEKIAKKNQVSEYVDILLAIIMVESRGEGLDIMQSAESAGLGPNGYTDPIKSLEQGISYFAKNIEIATSLGVDKWGAVGGYNFGSGYINFVSNNGKKHSTDVAEKFSKTVVAPSLGNRNALTYPYVNDVSKKDGRTYLYLNGGNFFYVDLVKQYITTSGKSNSNMVKIAEKELGNNGGQPYWSWYGFPSRVEWCAAFVSWVANQNGYIDSGVIPKFAYCPTGIEWFKSKNQWQSRGYTPKAGHIIFFDWDNDGVSDHVGIVEKVEGTTVYTIEGNSSDAVKRQSYPIGSQLIQGYGTPNFK